MNRKAGEGRKIDSLITISNLLLIKFKAQKP